MEEKQNEVVVNANEGGVANSESVANNNKRKVKITNGDLFELGFPEIVTQNTYFWDAQWMHANASYCDIQDYFYNALYKLKLIYEKHTNKTFEIKHEGNAIYLNNKEVFYLYASRRNVYKNQRLAPIKEIVKELLEKMSFEELKQEVWLL